MVQLLLWIVCDISQNSSKISDFSDNRIKNIDDDITHLSNNRIKDIEYDIIDLLDNRKYRG